MYRSSPSFSRQNVSVYDTKKQKTWGSIVSAPKSDNGNYYELLFENRADTPVKINAAISNIFGIGPDFEIRWFDPVSNGWTRVKDTIQISLLAKGRQVRIVAAGDELYFRDLVPLLRKNVLALHTIYPNPFNSFFTIGYSLPDNVQNLSFKIFNLRGQCIWSANRLSQLHPGSAFLKIDAKLATGIYVSANESTDKRIVITKNI